ncbi:GHKL domain-containing protein [Clostridium sp. P21]|uniref:GHKL domain-containing protein n=1 Tax=Clostridium muellerianum TaxID=2716538 RepID=A0A7Y0EFH7_9CLOT|nr:GHKL domain-containing protein [Clostridium muellerianum]NMM61510.1 GHKL domain-containing protein [Clostridium muellerianum]
MEIVKMFVITFFEISSFMILWCKFSLNKDKKILNNLCIVFFYSCVQTIVCSLFTYYGILIKYIILALLICFFYGKSFIESSMEVCIYSIVIIILQLITIYVLKVLVKDFNYIFFRFQLSVQVVLLLFSIVINYCVPNKKIYSITKINSRIVYYIILNFVGYILVFKIIWQYNKNLILNNMITFIIMLIFIVILNFFLCYYIAKVSEEKKIVGMYEKYHPIVENIIEEIRAKQHDFKNYLNTINGIIQVSKEEELKSVLLKYIKSVNYSAKCIDDIMYIDNSIVRAIIYSKRCEAEKKNINFSYYINNNLLEWKLKEYELSDILNNILNNAFEAVSDDSDKSVILKIFKDKDKNIIETKNSAISLAIPSINEMFNRGFSSKSGKNRGYGLYNIKKIVQSNGGNIELSFDNYYVCFKISI